jgi:hypothetical protein
MTQERAVTFNSALETGMRALCVLLPAFPRAFDLQRLTALDHLVVHTGDIGGPKSLHPQLPMRDAELLVRRRLVERGLHLMISRGLIERVVGENGIEYRAGDLAETFMMSLASQYLLAMQERGKWVVKEFGDLDDSLLRDTLARIFGQWIDAFQSIHQSLAVEA